MHSAQRWCFALAAVAVGFAACAPSTHEPVAPPPANYPSRQVRVPGEYLITLAEGARVGVIADAYGRYGIKSFSNVGPNLYLVKLTQDPGPEKLEERRGRSPGIVAVQPNLVYRASSPIR